MYAIVGNATGRVYSRHLTEAMATARMRAREVRECARAGLLYHVEKLTRLRCIFCDRVRLGRKSRSLCWLCA